MNNQTINHFQVARLKNLGHPGEIDVESMISVDQALEWLEAEYGLVYEIGLDKTTEPKYCFEIYQYEDFGNYQEIKVDEWLLYRSRNEAKSECLNQMLKYLAK